MLTTSCNLKQLRKITQQSKVVKKQNKTKQKQIKNKRTNKQNTKRKKNKKNFSVIRLPIACYLGFNPYDLKKTEI